MFRLQNNVPEIYPDQSRDFQMFCRLFDVAFNGVKQSVDTMQYITSTMQCDAALLPLLKDKLGFFTSLDLQERDLRYILDAFPTIIRYKGSKKAFMFIVNLYSRLVSCDGEPSGVKVVFDENRYTVEVSSKTAIAKSDLLFELLKYVLPTGYSIEYGVSKDLNLNYESPNKYLVVTNKRLT